MCPRLTSKYWAEVFSSFQVAGTIQKCSTVLGIEPRALGMLSNAPLSYIPFLMFLELGMKVHTYNPSTWVPEGEDHEFKSSLGYRARPSLRPLQKKKMFLKVESYK
jgi:hypothetical protein